MHPDGCWAQLIVLVAACRDLLLAYHHVPQVFDERAIRAVLADMQPEKARILWGSQNFQVGCSGVCATLQLHPLGNFSTSREVATGVWTAFQLHLQDSTPLASLQKEVVLRPGCDASHWMMQP